MSNFLRFGFIAILLTFVFGAVDARAQGSSDAISRMDKHYKALQTLQANVTMEKYNNQLGETDVYTGKVKYLPKTDNRVMYIRVDWVKPVEESMAVVGDGYRIYRPKLKQVYEGKTSAAKNNAKAGSAFAFLGMKRKELNDNFTYTNLGEETIKGGIRTIHLELTPKTAATYKVAHLWVDKEGMPLMIKIIEKNNDSTTILLSNLTKNAQINGGDFDIKYPKSIKPVR